MAIYDKTDVLGLVISGVLVVLAGILLSSRIIDFLTFWIMIFIGLIIPIAKLLRPIIIKDILKIEEEKRKVKEDNFDIWKRVWRRLQEERVGFATSQQEDKPSYVPLDDVIIQKYNIYVAEINLKDWITTVKQGYIGLNKKRLTTYSAVIVFDLYSMKVIEQNYGIDMEQWEQKFEERAGRGYYSKVEPKARIIIPEALAGFFPREMFGGTPEVGESPKKKD